MYASARSLYSFQYNIPLGDFPLFVYLHIFHEFSRQILLFKKYSLYSVLILNPCLRFPTFQQKNYHLEISKKNIIWGSAKESMGWKINRKGKVEMKDRLIRFLDVVYFSKITTVKPPISGQLRFRRFCPLIGGVRLLE